LEHRIGGLEKQDITGNISYDPDNHEHMVKTRQAKIDMIASYIPKQEINLGEDEGDILVVGWGSTNGVIKTVVEKLIKEGKKVSHCHLRYIRPFPANFADILKGFKHVIVPEINNGQLVKIIRSEFLIDAIPYNKIKGTPITQKELEEFISQKF
jgi:2-oxoglutarate ferredoxin oxidoreductase subunit alpha